jgi:hypothetical protein
LIADEARRWNVRCEDGKPIAAKQIIQWRKEINRKETSKGREAGAPAGAGETYAGLRRLPHDGWLEGPRDAAKRQGCEAFAGARQKPLVSFRPLRRNSLPGADLAR